MFLSGEERRAWAILNNAHPIIGKVVGVVAKFLRTLCAQIVTYPLCKILDMPLLRVLKDEVGMVVPKSTQISHPLSTPTLVVVGVA